MRWTEIVESDDSTLQYYLKKFSRNFTGFVKDGNQWRYRTDGTMLPVPAGILDELIKRLHLELSDNGHLLLPPDIVKKNRAMDDFNAKRDQPEVAEFANKVDKYFDDMSEVKKFVAPAIKKAWQGLYPDTQIFVFLSNDGGITVSTTKDNAKYWGGSDSGSEFSLDIGVSVIPTIKDDRCSLECAIIVEDGKAGDYKGAMSEIFGAIFNKFSALAKRNNADCTFDLEIRDDKSEGAWQAIASKLGANYTNT